MITNPAFSTNNPWLFIALIAVLAGCSDMKKSVSILDTREHYETFDGKYIAQVTPEPWEQALHAAPEVNEIFYLPDGESMVLLNFRGAVQAQALEKYLNGILERLLAHSPKSGVQARVILVGDAGYGQAQAMPDGTIAIPLRMIRETGSEDEIAWVLGHEVSHIILGHHDTDWGRMYQDKLLALMENTMDMTGRLLDASRKMGASTDDTALNGLLDVYNTSSRIFTISQITLFPTWQRVQEDEADLLGLDLAVKAGYSPDESDTALAKLGQWAGDEKQQREELLTRERERLKSNLASVQYSENYVLAFRESATDAVSSAVKTFKNKLASTHRDIEDRRSNLAIYLEREYEDLEQDPDVKHWEKQQNRSSTRTLMAAYEWVWTADGQFQDGDIGNAESSIKKAIEQSRLLNSQSYPRLVFHDIRSAQGNNEKARANLDIALKAARPSAEIYHSSLAYHIGQQAYPDASTLLDRAWGEYKEPPAFYPMKIRLNRLAGNEAAVTQLLQSCTLRASPDIRSLCKEEAGQPALAGNQ